MKWKFLLILFLIVILYLATFKTKEGAVMAPIWQGGGPSNNLVGDDNGKNIGKRSNAECLNECLNDSECNVVSYTIGSYCWLYSSTTMTPSDTDTSYVKVPD